MALGAIWNRLTIHEGRRDEPPDMERIVVSIDPAVSNEVNSDEHGITVEGVGADGRGYVLDDVSRHGSPTQCCNTAVAAFDRWEADAVVVEVNNGGDWLESLLKVVRPGLPVIQVRATRGKHIRAEPISGIYTQGIVSHVGAFPELEDQMCLMTAGGYEGEGSPDRVCSMVWGFTELFPALTTKTVYDEIDPFEHLREGRSQVGGY
jgi:phage terminase large subunit-like protein